MTQVNIKRVYEEATIEDGYRVFIDRLWPRGMNKERIKYDIWEKNIAPSPSLRMWFHEDPVAHWDMFVNLYSKEMDGSSEVKVFLDLIKKYPVTTLLYAAKDPVRNHARILQEYLKKHL